MRDRGPLPMSGPSNDVFEVLRSNRAMRRLKPDPVPLGMIRQILEAGTCAPSGQNLQPWAFLVLRDAESKIFFGARYRKAIEERFGAALTPPAEDRSPAARTARAAGHLARHMHEVPVIILVCGKRDWPFAVPAEARVGLAPPSYGSIYPCVENILLACRALGLGASLTTMHQLFEPDLHQRFEIPESYGIVAAIPVGFPQGRFGPVRRQPIEDVTHFERWGTHGFPVQ